MSGPIFTYFKHNAKWQDALQFSAILLFVIGYMSLAVLDYLAKSFARNRSLATLNARSNQEDLTLKNKLINNVKRQFSAKALKLPAFYWLNLDLFLFWASNLVGLMFLPTEMKSKGYAHHQIEIMTVQGLAGAFGRTSLAIFPLMWNQPIKFFRIFPMKGAILAVCFLSSFALGSPWSYYVLSGGVGLSNAIASASLLNVSQEVLGKKTNAFTWVLLSVGSGGLSGPILGAAVFDLSGSYRLAFEIASTMACLSATLSVLAAIARHSKERKKLYHAESLNRHRSHKMVPLDSLAQTLYIKRSPSSYFVFERQGDKYHFSRTIDRFECEDLRSRTVSDVEQLFHGKFDVENAIRPHELETELQIHQSEINTTIPE
ncbi:uncharacterized protein LOC142350505 [Convolutriloba macropyga]|uniref:uncharacterized protein LOC142350505 n=1 Tax=Convolutriloba macropyga TaxID=536237 RepID=UPI003F51B26A